MTEQPAVIIRELDHLIAFRRQDLIGRISRLADSLTRQAELLEAHPNDIPNAVGIVQAAGYEIDSLAGAVAALYEARSVAEEAVRE